MHQISSNKPDNLDFVSFGAWFVYNCICPLLIEQRKFYVMELRLVGIEKLVIGIIAYEDTVIALHCMLVCFLTNISKLP